MPIAPPRFFAIDLAEDIGTPQWWRGLALMLALIALALAFWPRLATVDAPPAMPLDRAMRVQFGRLATAPLLLGVPAPRPLAFGPLAVPIAFAPERTTVDLVATLSAGDTLTGVLQRAGAGSGDAARAAALIAAAIAPDQIAAGTRLDIKLGPHPTPGSPRALRRVALRARFDLALTVTQAGGTLTLTRQPIAVDTTPLRIRATVGSSLFLAARAAGAPIAAITQYLRTLAAHLSLDDIAPGDIADIIVSNRRARGAGTPAQSEIGDLLYAGLDRDGHPRTQLLRWGSDGQFYDALAGDGGGETSAGFLLPVAGHVTSNYGMRFHPILGYTRMHAGIDFGAPYGTPIQAVAAGTVVYAGVHGGHGNYVRIDHGGGLGTGYAHMSRIAVTPGERITAGAVIGFVGATGLATGPHLHYEVYENGRTVDPTSVHFTAHARVDPHEAAAFKARLAALLMLKPSAGLSQGNQR